MPPQTGGRGQLLPAWGRDRVPEPVWAAAVTMNLRAAAVGRRVKPQPEKRLSTEREPCGGGEGSGNHQHRK